MDLAHGILRADNQMHAEGTAERCKTVQPLHIVGQTVAKRVELVDDHDQSCWRIGQLIETRDAFGAHQSLTSNQLLFDGVQCTDRMGQVKIANVANRVWKLFQGVECRSALEIQKHEMQIVRAILHGER